MLQLNAQAARPVTFSGTIVVGETAATPVAGVDVLIAALRLMVKTDTSGRFSVSGLERGKSYEIIVTRVGLLQQLLQLDVGDSDSVNVLITMEQEPQEIAPVAVITEPSALPEFEERRRAGFGSFVTRRQLDSLSGATVTEVLRRRVPRIHYVRHCLGGFALASTSGNVSITPTPVVGKGCGMPPACYMQVFIDGILTYAPGMGGLPPQIDNFRATALEGIELYHGGAQVPPKFGGTGAACGTAVLWTRRTQ